MIGPHSSSKKPGDEDSWESLAEDLFGIDFHRGATDEDLEDDDDIPQATALPQASDDEVDDEFLEDEDLSFDDEELEAGFPEDEEDAPPPPPKRAQAQRESPRAETPQRQPAKNTSSKPEPVADESDSFWDALNDWDWNEKPRASRSEPAVEERTEPAAEKAEPSETETGDRSRRRRRRGRGRGRGDSGAPTRVSSEESPLARIEPEAEPLQDLEDDLDLDISDDDDDFGAGLITPSSRRRARPASRPAERVERHEEQPPRKPERSRQSTVGPARQASADEDFGDELAGEEGPPRRRRRRRRSGETTTERAPAPAESSFDEPPVEDEFDRPRRRRERTARPTSSEGARESRVHEEPRPIFKDVPTWAEAIGLLVHRRPKQTTTWTPEVEETRPRPEREGRSRSSAPNRRRRRRPS